MSVRFRLSNFMVKFPFRSFKRKTVFSLAEDECVSAGFKDVPGNQRMRQRYAEGTSGRTARPTKRHQNGR